MTGSGGIIGQIINVPVDINDTGYSVNINVHIRHANIRN